MLKGVNSPLHGTGKEKEVTKYMSTILNKCGANGLQTFDKKGHIRDKSCCILDKSSCIYGKSSHILDRSRPI